MEGEIEDVQEAKHQVQVLNNSSSSPSHEFSFTRAPPPFAAAIDLSPADEIFFHGHLLPLHLLSNLPVSPRSSTNSLDSFTLPIKELFHHTTTSTAAAAAETKTSSTTSSEEYSDEFHHHHRHHRHVMEGKGRGKSRSFTGLFGWRKREDDDDDPVAEKEKKSKPSKLDMLKRYVRLMKPFLFPMNKRRRRGNSDEEFLRRQPFSYSGNLRLKSNKKELRGRREFSAPVSMRNSPTNSGLLVASGSVTPTNKSDSTMEELQAAIQAAIAHCKNSSIKN